MNKNDKCCGDKCNSCQKKERCFDSCDGCKKEFCYECMGRVGNHLYCEPCYRQKEGLKETDQIIKSVEEEVDNYKLDDKGEKIKTRTKTTIYSWEVKRNTDE